MRRILPILLCVAVVMLCIGAPVAWALHMQAQTRNFHVVKEGVLYRSGQTTPFGLKNLIHDYGIRTVVSLRDSLVPDEAAPDRAEEAYCTAQEIRYLRIPPRRWEAAEGPAPVEEGVRKFRDLMSNPSNYPVLVHCFAGIHRTGAYCAVYRMEFEHWSNARAIEEVKAFGYTNLDSEEDILGYLERYKPARNNKAVSDASLAPR
jgi:protein tyrosine/serine phosphatase